MSLGKTSTAVYTGNAKFEPLVSVRSYQGFEGYNDEHRHTAALTSEEPPDSHSCPALDSSEHSFMSTWSHVFRHTLTYHLKWEKKEKTLNQKETSIVIIFIKMPFFLLFNMLCQCKKHNKTVLS